MIRSTIKINDYIFLCDLYLYDECIDKRRKKFYMLRNLYIDENSGNINDNDIYIIDGDLVNVTENGAYLSDDIIFPIPNKVLQFTTDVNNFCEVINPSLYELLSNTDNNTDDNTDDKQLKLIECHKVKLYHPNATHLSNAIIYVDNIINDVHFHYFCKKYSDLETHSETEIREFNTYFSEYVEFYLPNLTDLFSKDTVYIDNIIEYDNKIEEKYTPLYNYNLPYIADENKRFLVSINESDIIYSKYPYNITIFPFNLIEDNVFFNTTDLIPNSDIIISDNKLNFSATLSFREDNELLTDEERLTVGELVVKTEFSYHNNTNNIFDIYKQINNLNDTYTEDKYPCMYILELSSDVDFKNVIRRKSEPYIFDFDEFFDDIGNYSDYLGETPVFPKFNPVEFSIPLYSSWDQLPELLLYRVKFIDFNLGTAIVSNTGIISKENYKYLVNLNFKESLIKETYQIDLSQIDNMNFVDKITCVIKKNKEELQNISYNTTPKVIYKPIFYRTQDLQNIKIQPGVVQNIGINLLNYLNKVETFYITIDGKQFIETGRNDVYVIFSVQANLLTTASGSYHISNQDNEYISSGRWSLV